MWKYIVTPIIGAIIGYVTNWIAVKMLFRPRKEVRVFGKRLPFTPGVIPRGQARLAKAVGNVVETQLLTPEYMGEKLLSEESEKEFKSHIQAWVEEQKQSEDTLHSAAVKIVEEEKVDDFAASVEEDLTDFLSEKVIAMEPGKLIVDKVVQEAQRKLADSMFGMMLGGSFIEKIAGQIQEGIDAYIAENARGYIEKEVVAASEELQAKPIPEVTGFFEEKGISYMTNSIGLGLSREYALRKMILPVCFPELLGTIALGMAYGMGAVAPILYTGAVMQAGVPSKLTDPFMSLPYHLYTLVNNGFSLDYAYGTAFVLMLLLLIIQLLCKFVTYMRKGN